MAAIALPLRPSFKHPDFRYARRNNWLFIKTLKIGSNASYAVLSHQALKLKLPEDYSDVSWNYFSWLEELDHV